MRDGSRRISFVPSCRRRYRATGQQVTQVRVARPEKAGRPCDRTVEPLSSTYGAGRPSGGGLGASSEALVPLWPFSCKHFLWFPRVITARKEESTLSQPRQAREKAVSWAQIFSQARKPFASAMQALSAHRPGLLSQWRRQLRDLGLSDALPSELDLWNGALQIPEMSFTTFRGLMERVGEDLARSGVPLERLVVVMNSLLEAGLQYLIEDHAPCTLAVLRLNAVARFLLISAYSRQQEVHMHMIEAQLSEAEQRLHGASAYVTNVYEQERRRLSHDLHDEVGHDLVMLKLHLEVLAEDLRRGKLTSLHPRLQDALTLVSHTIESVRRLVMDLGPAVFDDLGFVPAIKFYARRFSSTTRIAVSVQEGQLPAEVPMSHQTALYRVLQGALSNVVKHAHAKHVKVALASLKNAVLVMTIEDDGTGFDADSTVPGRRFGLTAMRERIAVLGGKVHVQSWRAGRLGGRHGTRIEVDLPLPGGQTL